VIDLKNLTGEVQVDTKYIVGFSPQGNNFTIAHTSSEQPSPGNAVTIELDLLEVNSV
jgi:hypothetical protein